MDIKQLHSLLQSCWDQPVLLQPDQLNQGSLQQSGLNWLQDDSLVSEKEKTQKFPFLHNQSSNKHGAIWKHNVNTRAVQI